MSDDKTNKDLPADLDELVRRATATLEERQPAPRLHVVPDPPREERVGPGRRPEVAVKVEVMERWGIPPRLGMLISEPDRMAPTPAMAAVSQFLAEYEAGAGGRLWYPSATNILVLAGPHGVGKTVAAASMARWASVRSVAGYGWSKGETPLFHHAAELLSMGLYEHDEERRRIKRTPLLVVDDLGAEYMDGKGVWSSFVDWLINCRHEALGLSVITTNLDADHFRDRYGPRVYDRMRHVADWRDLDGPSLRGA